MEGGQTSRRDENGQIKAAFHAGDDGEVTMPRYLRATERTCITCTGVSGGL